MCRVGRRYFINRRNFPKRQLTHLLFKCPPTPTTKINHQQLGLDYSKTTFVLQMFKTLGKTTRSSGKKSLNNDKKFILVFGIDKFPCKSTH